jgi:lambda family phage portal protein
MRGGVEIDDFGAPVAYHFRRAHQNDAFDAAQSMVWDRVPRETAWGRPIVLHDHDVDRVGQARGIGILTPVLAKLKMLGRYDAAELQQALLQSVIGTFIESPLDPEQMQMAMDNTEGLSNFQAWRADAHEGKQLRIGDTRIPTLVPGEKINFAPPRHPTTNFAEFEHAVLRNVASAIGTTAEAISSDYSKANYSSLRAAMLDAWRTMMRRRSDFATGTATPVYTCWLEEFIERNPVLLPAAAPAFMEMRAAYSRCDWIGPGRGWVDPVKERQGAVLGLDAGFGTLREECANISGADWREVIEQRALEVAEFKRLGLHLPDWSGDQTAAQDETKPQPV